MSHYVKLNSGICMCVKPCVTSGTFAFTKQLNGVFQGTYQFISKIKYERGFKKKKNKTTYMIVFDERHI